MSALSILTRRSIAAALVGCALVVSAAIGAGDTEDVAMGTRLAELLRAGRSVVFESIRRSSTILQLATSTSTVKKSYHRGHRRLLEKHRSRPAFGRIDRARPASARSPDRGHARGARRTTSRHQSRGDWVQRLRSCGFCASDERKIRRQSRQGSSGARDRARATRTQPQVASGRLEANIIEGTLSDPKRPKGEALYGGHRGGRTPRHFACCFPNTIRRLPGLSCHGEPKGAIDVTGYPKEGGKAGDLGGAISIVLFK